ncbi:MAG: cell wall hydrolase [Alphaproteobacteria bacterium]|nr:MAG: cell wall hydrolase [Alphaproteobacteria bacterium]
MSPRRASWMTARPGAGGQLPQFCPKIASKAASASESPHRNTVAGDTVAGRRGSCGRERWAEQKAVEDSPPPVADIDRSGTQNGRETDGPSADRGSDAMSRMYLLALLAALLAPAVLPDRTMPAGERPVALVTAAHPAPRPQQPAQVEPPRSLEEALWRVSERARGALDPETRCLAQAVYFEARSEPLEGQLAVAQVVLNRVRTSLWPDHICAVVFEGEQRRHRCQFSFACDGRSDEPRDRRAWAVAKMVALVAREGLWQDVTGAATHYHAVYVAPAWRRAMAPTVRYGDHVFYRDRRLTRTAALNAKAPAGGGGR